MIAALHRSWLATLAGLLWLWPRGASAAPLEGSVRVEEPPAAAAVAAMRGRLREVRSSLAGLPPAGRLGALSLEHEAARIAELLRGRLTCNPELELRRLEEDGRQLVAGKRPHEAAGLHRLAYRSPLDGNLHGFALYVPEGYASNPGRRWPLIVMLHGMGSNPVRALGRLFGIGDRDLRDPRIRCDRPSLAGGSALVLAPGGFGDALYRLFGETDVEATLRQVFASYRVDTARVTLTGLSMGGTGAVEIALQRPGRYAGVLALCGYYDRRQDSALQGEPLLPWEKHLASVHSPVDWAENGRGIPLTLVHGTEDGPGRARRIEARYQALGYPVTLELHKRGHDVWIPGYQERRAFAILTRYRRGGAPRLVTFATGRPRVQQGHWVRIERFADHRRWARVRAEILDGTRLRATTENVRRLRLTLPRPLPRGKAVSLQIDGQSLELLASRGRGARRAALLRDPGSERWRLLDSNRPEAETAPVKRAGLSGPIEDIYFEPLLVVYGTAHGQGPALRAVADRLARFRKHVTIRYRVLPDRQLSTRLAERHALILVGNERSNTVLGRLGPRLPIRVLEGEVRIGARSWRGPQLGASFIYPNPEAPERYLRVVGGSSARSFELHEMLPTYLPDYVVFDEGVAGSRPAPILGARRSLRAGGYFDERWQLSEPPLEVPVRAAAKP
jgi:predicted esterase